MERTISYDKIKERIINSEPNTIFITSDFMDLASVYAANGALRRLVKDGTIHQVMRGIYNKPKFNEKLQLIIPPTTDDIAKSIAKNYGWKIIPSGNIALNMLGLSTQVPAKWEYVSDGPYKTYDVNHSTIIFKHAANKEISNMSYESALLIQALKAIGKEHIDYKMIKKISSQIKDWDKEKLLNETQYTTSWIYEVIRRICDE